MESLQLNHGYEILIYGIVRIFFNVYDVKVAFSSFSVNHALWAKGIKLCKNPRFRVIIMLQFLVEEHFQNLKWFIFKTNVAVVCCDIEAICNYVSTLC